MILLNSVGTALTRKLNTHPILEDGTIDRDEGTTTHVYDLDNEWKTSIWGMWEEHNNCFLNLEAK